MPSECVVSNDICRRDEIRCKTEVYVPNLHTHLRDVLRLFSYVIRQHRATMGSLMCSPLGLPRRPSPGFSRRPLVQGLPARRAQHGNRAASDGINSTCATWGTTKMPQPVRRPEISKDDEHFRKAGYEFVDTAGQCASRNMRLYTRTGLMSHAKCVRIVVDYMSFSATCHDHKEHSLVFLTWPCTCTLTIGLAPSRRRAGFR